MRLTPRCEDLIRLTGTARWLATGQLKRRFFPTATPDAARKRLRILTGHGYLRSFRTLPMTEALFSLGPEGKRFIENGGHTGPKLERNPPAQIEHLLGINDVRIAAELAPELKFFYAAWELPRIGWQQPLIPDAVFGLGGRVFALEFDRGVEGIQFFLRTKMAIYKQGLAGVPVSAVLIVADRLPRMQALSKAIGNQYGPVRFAPLQQIRNQAISVALN